MEKRTTITQSLALAGLPHKVAAGGAEMQYMKNPFLGLGMSGLADPIPTPSTNKAAVASLLTQCPAHRQTPLVNATDLAAVLGVGSLHVKDERTRMQLGSFKALGAAYVIACDAQTAGGDFSQALAQETYVTASAGNHGMSVAAGARVFGAQAVIYLSKTVPDAFAQKLRGKGAQVVIEGENYEASMQAATEAAMRNGWRLLSDSSWDGYFEVPHRLMEGYLQMAAEAFEQMPTEPTHIILQAGVGGMAAAVAAMARETFGEKPVVVVVEPEAAPALYESIEQGKAVQTSGPVSSMGRLDCKEPSLIALKGLSRDADFFALITETEGSETMQTLAGFDLATTPSGGAGLSFLLATEDPNTIGLGEQAHILAFLTEVSGP